jgi:hypothetical protein
MEETKTEKAENAVDKKGEFSERGRDVSKGVESVEKGTEVSTSINIPHKHGGKSERRAALDSTQRSCELASVCLFCSFGYLALSESVHLAHCAQLSIGYVLLVFDQFRGFSPRKTALGSPKIPRRFTNQRLAIFFVMVIVNSIHDEGPCEWCFVRANFVAEVFKPRTAAILIRTTPSMGEKNHK